MSLSFEELADTETERGRAFKNEQRKKRARRLSALAAVTTLILVAAFLYYWTSVRKVDPVINEAASILLQVDAEIDSEAGTPGATNGGKEPGVSQVGQERLAHKRDDATEFSKSFETLDSRIRKPEYRQTEAGQALENWLRVQPEQIKIRRRDPETGELVATVQTQSFFATWAERVAARFTDQKTEVEAVETVAPAGATRSLSTQSSTVKTSANEETDRPETAAATLKPSTREARDIPNASANSNAAELPENTEVRLHLQRDWGGVILVPEGITTSQAHTSNVQLLRIEAHPLNDERLRVWARVKNRSQRPIHAEMGCEFRSRQAEPDRVSFEAVTISPAGVVDVSFDSPRDRVEAYTLMVKRQQ